MTKLLVNFTRIVVYLLWLQSSKEMENKVYKVVSEWKLDNLKEKFKGKEICIL